MASECDLLSKKGEFGERAALPGGETSSEYSFFMLSGENFSVNCWDDALSWGDLLRLFPLGEGLLAERGGVVML